MMEPSNLDPQPSGRFRFGVFEADVATGELRKHGLRIKLNVQPFQVLVLLLSRPGELLTREQIAGHLWPDGTFVDFEHGVNSAVNRIRDALGDKAANPRFIETLARRGYRFIAPVETIRADAPVAEAVEAEPYSSFLTATHELPRTPHRTVRLLFLGLQLMYVGFYVGALANLAEIEELLSPLAHPAETLTVLIVTAASLIPLRAFVVSAVLFQAPSGRGKLLKLWPLLLVFDELWALSPFLLLHHINFGLALASMALLVYSPFAQRSLILMGAADAKP